MAIDEDRDILVWTSRIYTCLHLLVSATLGVTALVAKDSPSAFVTTALLRNWVGTSVDFVARLAYYWIIPALRFYAALWLADTWVFFVHRAEHGNKWLYSKWEVSSDIHSLMQWYRDLSRPSSRIVRHIQLGWNL